MNPDAIERILECDAAREALARQREEAYDPATGTGSPVKRKPYTLPQPLPGAGNVVLVPEAMLADPEIRGVRSLNALERLRFRYDFEYWAWRCVRIRDKESGCRIPFRLNAPQRRFLGMLESDRLAGRPMRFVMLKARQWGGSALCYLLIYLNSAE